MMQTDLQEIQRIINDDSINAVRSLTAEVIRNRESRQHEAEKHVLKLQRQIKAGQVACDLAQEQKENCEALISELQPEVDRLRYENQECLATLSEVEKEKVQLHSRLTQLKNEIKHAEQWHKQQADAYLQVFGLSVKITESDEIEITVNMDVTYNHRFVIICRKDRSRRGLNLQIVSVDPNIRGSDELERAYRDKEINLMKFIMEMRQIYSEFHE